MNKKILSVYYKSIISAVILIVAIWIAASMLLVFSNNEVDENLPQYRILAADSYITISDEEVNVSQEFLESLSKYDLWMQVLDEDGNAIYQENVPLGVPQKYTAIQLVDACLKSDKIPGMTVYASDIETAPGYCVLIGCDSHVVNKLSYSFVGNGRDEISKVLIIFVLVLISVVILYSFLFMKRITEPIGNIMGAIGKIDDEQFDMPVYHGQIFSEVFCELGKLREKLKQTKCQRMEWTANISHDIKTPLSTIKGYAEVLADDEYDFTGEEVKQYMSETLKAEESIEELVEELNLSSKLSEGKYLLKKEKVDLTELINECIAKVDSNMMGDSTILLNSDEDVILEGDRKLLKRCFLNVMYNAFVHNKAGITLNIRIKKSGHIVLTFTDDGIGMSQEEASHIFERYYRGTNSQKTKGSGLGLAIAREVVVAHGGSISVETELNKGTSFIISF